MTAVWVLFAAALWVVAYFVGRADGLRLGRLRLALAHAALSTTRERVAGMVGQLRELERRLSDRGRDEERADWWRHGAEPEDWTP